MRRSVRELEGLLNLVMAFASLTGRPLSLEVAKETLMDILPEDAKVSAAEIIKTVAHHKGYLVAVSRSRPRSSMTEISPERDTATRYPLW